MATNQTEITEPRDLLDERGRITREGWARYPYWRYDRNQIRASALRIKEWDYYAIIADRRDEADGERKTDSAGGADRRDRPNHSSFGLTITMSDLGYAGLFAVCFLDFQRRYCHQVGTSRVMPLGRTGFPSDPEDGTVTYRDRTLELVVAGGRGERTITFKAPGLRDGRGEEGLQGEIRLEQPPELESMTIATSWAEKRTAFYYNRKINCMPASGGFTIGGNRYEYSRSSDFGTLDWGRGVWTYRNRWYWGSASGNLEGVPFGFNIGYGFSDRSPASENTLFYRGRAHKIGEVTFHYDPADYLKPWRFTSSDTRLEMSFQPILDRTSETNLGIIRSSQHQVFGRFSGTAVLDDGTRLAVKDLLGFAEDVYNRW